MVGNWKQYYHNIVEIKAIIGKLIIETISQLIDFFLLIYMLYIKYFQNIRAHFI